MENTLLTEHLQFTPLTLLDDIINTVNEVVTRAVDAAESGLLSTDPANLGFDKKAQQENRQITTDGGGDSIFPEARIEIEEGLHKLETLLESNVDRNFDKFEIYTLRGVLNVPTELVPWVRLGHYEGIQLPIPGRKSPAVEEVQELQHRLRQTRKLNLALERTARRNGMALAQLRSLIDPESNDLKAEPSSDEQSPAPHSAYTFLSSGADAKALGMTRGFTKAERANDDTAAGPLETNTSFALSQLPALRDLLNELRPRLSDLGDAQSAAQETHTARERRVYLDKQVQKAIERQGIESDVGGGYGRRIPEEEVTALEEIAERVNAVPNEDDEMEE